MLVGAALRLIGFTVIPRRRSAWYSIGSIGKLFITPPSQKVSPSMITGEMRMGIAELAATGITRSPWWK
jgi:hypothetical protein